LVQNAPGSVSAPSSAAGLSPSIHVILELIRFVTVERNDAVIRAHLIAHGASHTGVSGIGFLPNALKDLKDAGGRLIETQSSLDSAFAIDAQFYGIDRANRSTPTAKGALVFVPVDLPGQVLDAQ
jgi:hypothetical protein